MNPRIEVKLQACFNVINPLLTVALLTLITFMFTSFYCNNSTTFNFFIPLFMEIFVPHKYREGSGNITKCFNFLWNFPM